jgi:hypothetical protein
MSLMFFWFFCRHRASRDRTALSRRLPSATEAPSRTATSRRHATHAERVRDADADDVAPPRDAEPTEAPSRTATSRRLPSATEAPSRSATSRRHATHAERVRDADTDVAPPRADQ